MRRSAKPLRPRFPNRWRSAAAASIALLIDHAEDFATADSIDFGCRSREQAYIADIMAPLGALPFSHAQAIYHQTPIDVASLTPPYGRKIRNAMTRDLQKR